MVPLLLLGTRMNAGAVGPGFVLGIAMPNLTWPECVGSFWMAKALMPSTCPHIHQTWIQNLWNIVYWSIQSLQVAPHTFQEPVLRDYLLIVVCYLF